jgi:hypothetical protein
MEVLLHIYSASPVHGSGVSFTLGYFNPVGRTGVQRIDASMGPLSRSKPLLGIYKSLFLRRLT